MHVLHAFMFCLRFVLVARCMRICHVLVHLCMLRMRMTYLVPRQRHMPACTFSMLVMPGIALPAPTCSSSDEWACVSIGMHAIWQAQPRARQRAKRD